MSTDAFWARYDAVLARLLSPLTPSDGIPDQEIAEAEGRLGFRLPLLLREFYLRAGANKVLMCPAENEFVRPVDLQVENGWLTVWSENQGVVYHGIREVHVGIEDPPVSYTWTGDYGDADELTVPLSVYLLETLMMQCAVHDMNYASVPETVQVQTLPAEEDGWERIVSVHNGGEFFVRDGQALWITGRPESDYFVHAGARTAEDAAAINTMLGTDLEFFE